MLKGRTTERPVELPHADLTSSLPLSKSLGLLEKMGEGFARAMDDDFNSREAVAKVLGAVREMTKTFNSGLDAAEPVFSTVKGMVGRGLVCPGTTIVVTSVMSTVASRYSPAMTRVVSDKTYPLPADVIENETMSTWDRRAFGGTVT